MLTKVLKHELHAESRLLIPFFGAALATSAILRLMLFISPYIWAPLGYVMELLASSIGVLIIVGVILLACAYVIVRFYQSMVANEAYLTFTLPVKPSTHIWARTIAAILYILAGFLVAFACGLIIIPGFGDSLMQSFSAVKFNGVTIPMSEFSKGNQTAIWLLLGGFFLVTVLTLLFRIYASFAIGGRFRSRILGSGLTFLVLHNVEGILSLPLVALPMIGVIGYKAADIEAYFARLLDPAQSPNELLGSLLGLLGLVLAIYAALCVVFSILHLVIANIYFGKKLNLE